MCTDRVIVMTSHCIVMMTYQGQPMTSLLERSFHRLRRVVVFHIVVSVNIHDLMFRQQLSHCSERDALYDNIKVWGLISTVAEMARISPRHGASK